MRGSVHLVCTETEIVGIAGIGDAPVSAPFVDATFQLTNRKIGEHGTRARALRECSRTGAEQSERRGYAVGISSASPPPDSTARARPSGAFCSPWGSGPSCIPHRPVPEWRSAEASSSGATSLPVRRTDAPTGGIHSSAEDRRQRLIFRWGHCPRKRLCSMSVFSRISRSSGVSSSVPLILRMASPFRADKKPPAERIRWCKPAFAPRPHSAVCAGQKLRKIVPGITTRYSGFRRFLQPRSSKGHPLPKVLFIVIMLYYI